MNYKKMIMPVFFATLALLFPPAFSFSQTLPLKHYSLKDGLPDYSVTCIFQDSHGFLWFGTEHGFSRFNGWEFENFSNEKYNLKNEVIADLFEDREGNLWVATRGSGVICINSGKIIKSFTTRDGLPDNKISSIAEDREGTLWFGTNSGICEFDGKTFRAYFQKDGLVNDSVTDLLFDKSGNLWIGSKKGLSCLTEGGKNETKRFVNYTKDNGFINDIIYSLTLDHSGNVWIATSVGLYRFRNENGKPGFVLYSSRDGLVSDFVYAVKEDRYQNIWIGALSGVSVFSSGTFTNYSAKNGFLDDKIYSIFEDKEGNLWFGTPMGASRLQPLRVMSFSDKDGLPGNVIWRIIEEREGKYWIGTNKGLSCYSGGTFKTYTTQDGLINNTIYNLLKDRKGNIWAATDLGVSVYYPGQGTFINYTVKDGLPSETVLSFEEDRNGAIWIGTTMGICRFIDGRIKLPKFDVKLEPRAVHAILYDKKGNLWFSDTKGLLKVSGDKATRYTTRDGLIGESVYSLMEDSKGNLWIGTRQGGVSCLSNGKFKNYSTADGLSDNECLSLLEDDSHTIWIGTRNGLNRFNGKSFKTYTMKDGLISDAMSQSACLKDSSGNLWFGTVNGISRFNPNYAREISIPPPVYITQFSVSGVTRPISGAISLKHDDRYIKFNFIGLSYTSPKDVKYEYRLEGMDNEWFETWDRFVSYSSLPSGNYVFKVIAKNKDGVKSVKPMEIRFTVLPPFWQTWWFLTLSVLFLIFPVTLIIRIQNKWVKKKMANEAKNKQLVMAQRMKLMGVLAGGAVHDLKNLLTIIIGYSDLAHDNSDDVSDEEKNEALDIIKSTADTAFQVVRQILAFARQNYDEIKVTDLSNLLNEILSILKITIPRTIDILWDPPAEKIYLSISPVKFKQVVMNLCLNAVQAMGDRGQLKIVLANDPVIHDQIIIEISDTGLGIKKEYLDKIFEPLFTTKEEEKGSGLGLFVVKQIIDEYKGKIEVHSSPGEGATFKIYFPNRGNAENVDYESMNIEEIK